MNPEELLRRAFEARADTRRGGAGRARHDPPAHRRRRPRRRAITIGLASLATTAAAAAATVAIAFDLPRQATRRRPTATDGTPTRASSRSR